MQSQFFSHSLNPHEEHLLIVLPFAYAHRALSVSPASFPSPPQYFLHLPLPCYVMGPTLGRRLADDEYDDKDMQAREDCKKERSGFFPCRQM